MVHCILYWHDPLSFPLPSLYLSFPSPLLSPSPSHSSSLSLSPPTQPKTADEILNFLTIGNRNRTQHPTDANASSSRSHAVFQVNGCANVCIHVHVHHVCKVYMYVCIMQVYMYGGMYYELWCVLTCVISRMMHVPCMCFMRGFHHQASLLYVTSPLNLPRGFLFSCSTLLVNFLSLFLFLYNHFSDRFMLTRSLAPVVSAPW